MVSVVFVEVAVATNLLCPSVSDPGVLEQRRSESLPRNRAVRSSAGVAAARPAALEAHGHHRAVHPLLSHDPGQHL